MAITPKQVTVDQLFGTQKYDVDFYQREYKWNDSPQQTYKPIKSLLDDIIYRFSLNYDPNSDIDGLAISKYDWYYLNSFMTNTVGGNTYIVDGQQRLTTLTIILISLLKIGIKLNVTEGYLEYLKQKIRGFDAIGNTEFWMGFDDRKKGLTFIYNLPPGQLDKLPEGVTVSEKNIYEAYNVIYKYLEQYLMNEHIYNAFRLYFCMRIYLISIDVDERKDVAMAFEVINDRGIPLKAYEILKGKILGVIPSHDVSKYVDIWENSIDQLSMNYNDDIVDLFLSTYFQSKFSNTNQSYNNLYKDRYHKSIYLNEFNSKIGFKNNGSDTSSSIKKVKEFVENTLPFYSDFYHRILKDSNDHNSEYIYTWFNKTNDQDYQFYLILSAIDVNDPEKDSKYNLVTKLFDKLYVMTNLTGAYRSNDFAASVIELGREIRNKNLSEIRTAFDNTLINNVSKSLNRANISSVSDVFKYDLFSNAGYTNLGKRFLRYYFARIDRLIADECNIPTGTYYSLIKQAGGKEVYHIEHILAYDSLELNKALFKNEEEFIVQRNRLGGLVLLKGKDNISSGNELYEDKLKTYEGTGTLFARTLLPNFNHSNVDFKKFCANHKLTFNSYPQFNISSIEERQKLLHALTCIIWDV